MQVVRAVLQRVTCAEVGEEQHQSKFGAVLQRLFTLGDEGTCLCDSHGR